MESRKMTLIDTSSWVEALRSKGDPATRNRVKDLIEEDEAVWCEVILVELWNGARGDYEKRMLRELEKEIRSLEIDSGVWRLSRRLAEACRTKGRTVPVVDLMIAACALYHKADLEYCDNHFDTILQVHSQL